MKRNHFKSLGGMALGLVLLAAIPFTAQAQAEANSADSEKNTITFTGTIDGSGSFIFEGNTIRYLHKMFQHPTDVSINEKRWDNLDSPFQLGFVPDFLTAEIAGAEGRGIIELSKNGYQFELFIDDTPPSPPAPYHVTISVKKNAHQEDYTPPEKKEIVLAGTFAAKSFFLFENNTIRYLHGNGSYPTEVSINGKPWSDLEQPFILDDMLESVSAEIEEKKGRNAVNLYKEKDLFYLSIFGTEQNISDYQIKIGARIKETSDSGTHKKEISSLKDSEVAITLEGMLDGVGTFSFQKDKVYYQHNLQNSPEAVSINGQKWIPRRGTGFGAYVQTLVPEELGFVPDFSSARILQTKGNRSISINRQKDRFDLTVNLRQRGATPYFMVTVAVKKQTQEQSEAGNKEDQQATTPTRPSLGYPFLPPTQMYDADYTTDGEMHKSGGGDINSLIPDLSDTAKMNQTDITIEGVIDKKALFFIAENMILYQEGSGIGEYPRGVTVNGQPWRNLHVPFALSVGVETDSVSDLYIKSDTLEYSLYAASHHQHSVLSITNHGEPTKFQVRLVMLKKDGISWKR